MIELRVLGRTDLRGPDESAARALLAQPKLTALLVYLAAALPGDFHRRDHLVGLFWAESDQEHARANLRKLVHGIRRSLGDDVLETRGDEELRLVPAKAWCDAAELEECLGTRRHARVIELYRGQLLPGFILTGAPGFQSWLELTRRRLGREAIKAVLALADDHASRLERTAVGDLVDYIMQREPELEDEHQLRKLVSLVDEMGNRAGALRMCESFRQRLWLEFRAQPSAETRALIQRLQSG